MRVLLLIGLLGLASCAHAPTAQQIAANDDATCQSYGAVRGTQNYIQCRMQIAQQRNANRAALAGAILANRPVYQPVQPYQMPVPQQKHCTTTYIGDQAYTNCY